MNVHAVPAFRLPMTSDYLWEGNPFNDSMQGTLAMLLAHMTQTVGSSRRKGNQFEFETLHVLIASRITGRTCPQKVNTALTQLEGNGYLKIGFRGGEPVSIEATEKLLGLVAETFPMTA